MRAGDGEGTKAGDFELGRGRTDLLHPILTFIDFLGREINDAELKDYAVSPVGHVFGLERITGAYNSVPKLQLVSVE